MDKLRVLITNDDGIESRGLQALVEEFSQIADVYVVAPEGERSSASHHLTLRGKIRIEERKMEGTARAYAFWGTPADCVHLGVKLLFPDQIDLVISGINRGLNVSSDMTYSGTVGAAREAFLQGVPSIAVSLDYSLDNDYRPAARYARTIGLKYLDSKEKNIFLNINVPDLEEKDMKGILICDRQARIRYDESLELISEDGTEYIHVIGAKMKTDCDSNDLRIDYSAVKAGYVSVSPLGNQHILPEYAGKLQDILKED